MVLSLLLAIILFVCFAMLIREGLWNNVLTAVNALFAGLIACSLWELLATWLEGFEWTTTAVLGASLALLGNYVLFRSAKA